MKTRYSDRDAVDRDRQQVLQPVHLMDVGVPHQTERRQHHDPDARAEIAAVDPDHQLKQHRPRQPVRAGLMEGGQVEAALQRLLHHEQARGEQNQQRDQLLEQTRRRPLQQDRARKPADQARNDQRVDARIGLAHLAAEAPGAAERPRPQGHGAGRVGVDRRNAQPDQRRHREEGSAARDRIDGAAGTGSEKHEQ